MPSSASCMLLVMDELERGSLDPTIGRPIVAFGAAEHCTLESRAAIAAAGEILADFLSQDLTDVASRREAINADAYLPPAWQIGLDETFLAGMANAMTLVSAGLTDADWDGPANTAEELCLKAILDHASEVIPDLWKIEDRARLQLTSWTFARSAFRISTTSFCSSPRWTVSIRAIWAPRWESSPCPDVTRSRGLGTASASSKSVRRKSNRWWAVVSITRTAESPSRRQRSASNR